MKPSLVVVLSALLACAVSCTTMQYNRGSAKVVAKTTRTAPEGTTFRSSEFNSTTNTLTGMDTTGTACAGMGNAASKSNASSTARSTAIANGQSSYSYKYKTFQASSFSGLRCGGYLTWGTRKNNDVRFTSDEMGQSNRTDVAKTSVTEGGLILDWGESIGDSLIGTAHLKLGVGNWAIDEAKTDILNFAFGFTAQITPWWLYGIALRPRAEFNLGSLGFGYGMAADYSVVVSDHIALTVGAEYERRSLASGSPAEGTGSPIKTTTSLIVEDTTVLTSASYFFD